MARTLSVDPGLPADLVTLPGDHAGLQIADPPHYSDAMRVLGKQFGEMKPRLTEPPSKDFNTAWNAFANLMYHWDAAIQDRLLSKSDRLANAYELGRALAEPFWALDPGAPPETEDRTSHELRPNPVSWQFLLGPERRAVVTRLLGRLGPYFPPLAAPAIASSFEVWGTVVAPEVDDWWPWGTRKKAKKKNDWWTADDAQAMIASQTGNWYSLLIAGLDPETLLKPYALLRSWKIFKKTFRVFGLELAVGLIGAGAVAVFGVLAANTKHSELLKALFGVLGVLGVSGASLQARLKATTQSSVTRLRQDLLTDLVASQITVTPTAPKGVRDKWLRQRAIGNRGITAPLS
ncbi:MAG TPA: hypothetical protein VGP46_12670 [Acidimicrobiales bacterium]|nr:hypothetical protein [Acidimicrobiales bacterium]